MYLKFVRIMQDFAINLISDLGKDLESSRAFTHTIVGIRSIKKRNIILVYFFTKGFSMAWIKTDERLGLQFHIFRFLELRVTLQRIFRDLCIQTELDIFAS